MKMRLFFVLVTLAGTGYLLYKERGDRRFAIGAVAASCFGMLLQLNILTLRVHHARTVVWAAIAICTGFVWAKEASKTAATIAASVVFVSALTVALSLRLLR